MSTQDTSPIVNRIVIVCGLVAIVAIVGFFVLQWSVKYASVIWSEESFGFESGVRCYVFPEPKLAIFLVDDDTKEVFDRINQHGSVRGTNVNGFSTSIGMSKSGNVVVSSTKIERGKMEMEFLDGKCKMVVSERGTKLTLADGREFLLDGKTPLWLRCKSDGTIDHLDELPKGFVEFFESPPSNPGMIGNVKSYPDAFRK